MLLDVTDEGCPNRGKGKKTALVGKVLLLLVFGAMVLALAMDWSPGGGRDEPWVSSQGRSSGGRMHIFVAGGRMRWLRPRIETIRLHVDGDTMELTAERCISDSKFGWGESVAFTAPEGANEIRVEAFVNYRRSSWRIVQEWQHAPDDPNVNTWVIQHTEVTKLP